MRTALRVAIISAAAVAALIQPITASDRVGTSTPVIRAIAPPAPVVSDRPQALAVSGEAFQPGLTLEVAEPDGGRLLLKGDDLRALTATSFEVSVLLALPGRHAFIVTNPDGGVSPPFVLAVSQAPARPAPAIVGIDPAEPVALSDPQTLRVEGRGFESGLWVVVTDSTGATLEHATVRDVTRTAFRLVVVLEHPGRYELVVTNPGGGVSNVFAFRVRQVDAR